MSNKGDLITQYLLGLLSEPEQAALEIECFADKERFEEVAAAEKDLIDDYLRGTLSADEHGQFERHFLSSPRRRERVQAARILLRSLASVGVADDVARVRASRLRPPISVLRHRRTEISWALAAAATLLVLLGGSWLLRETYRLRQQVLQAQAEQLERMERERELERQWDAQRGRADQLSEELASLRDQLSALEAQREKQGIPSTEILSFFLTPGFARSTGGETQKLTITPGIRLVKLRLTIKQSDYQSYRAIVQTPEGAQIWTQTVRPAPTRSGGAVVVEIPANRFSRNDYVLKIIGTTATGEADDVSSSYFRVER